MKKYTTSYRLKQIMTERNLKQVDILNMAYPYCKKFGVKLGKNDLSQYVSGKVEPGQNKLFILGLALNVNEAWLMGFDVPMEKSKSTYTIENKFDKNLDVRKQQIIKNFELMNEQGKDMLLDYSEFLIGNEKYIEIEQKEKHA